MGEQELPRRIMECKPEGRNIGRPRLRWLDGVVEDTRRTGVKQWWMVAKNRESWRRILREGEPRPGLFVCCWVLRHFLTS